jgi:nicotinate-nucleotide pyrophosphorylase (carboxylating)
MSATLTELVSGWLLEDGAGADLTTLSVVDPSLQAQARLLLKERGVVCGLVEAQAVYAALGVDCKLLASEGELSEPGPIAEIRGAARAILTGERTALNVLGRLSGVATLTRRYVDAVAGTGAVILDTRKTTPGLRELEKRAVKVGGGTNHRRDLTSGILIKDNHLLFSESLTAAVKSAKTTGLTVEVECDTLSQVAEALACGAEQILLDNMSLDELGRAVALAAGRVPLEASGGVTLGNVRAVALTGVDFISVGALTHSAHSLDVSLEVL